MGHGAVAGLTRLCYMITQPVGCPPVKCLLTLMNGCNMPRITTHHATHSLMASHNGRDVPPMPQKGLQREGEAEGGEKRRSRTPPTRRTSRRKTHGVLVFFARRDASIAVTRDRVNERRMTEIEKEKKKTRGNVRIIIS